MFSYNNQNINKLIELALEEDCVNSDITTRLTVGDDEISNAFIVAKEPCILCGDFIPKLCSEIAKMPLEIVPIEKDGTFLKGDGTKVVSLKGSAKYILSLERFSFPLELDILPIPLPFQQYVCHVSGIL